MAGEPADAGSRRACDGARGKAAENARGRLRTA